MDDHFDVGLGFLFKLAKGILKDFLYDIVCYTIGWLILRVLTVGKYPAEGLTEGVRDPESSESAPNIVGFALLAIASYYLFS